MSDFDSITNRLRARLTGQGQGFVDRYDPDFIIGVLMEWLSENSAVLTAQGVRRV